MNPKLSVFAVFVPILTLITMAACGSLAGTPAVTSDRYLLPMSTETSSPAPCEGCAQATLAALLTQEKNNTDAQAAATAEIMLADARATLLAVDLTQRAVLTQEKNNADIIAAQVAATANVIRANAQATLNSASSTQSAAQTQDAIRQTQEQFSLRMTADVATQNANATITQQNNNLIAAKTQTAVAANQIVTQTQSAVATLQKFADLERQRKEQDLARIAFVGMFCLPVLIGLGLLFVWRWIRIQENQQRIEMQLSTPPAEPEPVYSEPIIIEHIKYIEHEPSPRSAVSNSQNQPANPTDHVFRWLEEVKRKLLANKKDNDDKPTS